MEPISIFAASVGLVGVCRLTFVAVDFFGKGISRKRNSLVKRDDWYCFFKTSELLGTGTQDQISVPRDSLERRRRLQQRPRLQAERNMR